MINKINMSIVKENILDTMDRVIILVVQEIIYFYAEITFSTSGKNN